jgi:uncharacterized glyoxalase superfamily protein PhnB
MASLRPMIHVADVRRTAEWYVSIGFTLNSVFEDEGEMSWAALSFGDGAVMFNGGGHTSADDRREVDLYVDVDDVAALFERLHDRVQIVEPLHTTFYGIREFIVRDLNGFWITFGQSER